jgi:hypothetical protein
MKVYWNRFRTWFTGQWRKSGRLGKLALLIVPVLFGCCALTMFTALLSPATEPTPEPVAEVAERAATAEPPAATGEPATDEPAATVEPPTAEPTTRPTNTARPTATAEPTRPPVRAATALAATVIADQLTVTAVPAAATRPPATSTNAPFPTATSAPPTAAPATEPPAPTAPPPVAAGDVVIASIRYNGDINPQEPDEYAVITNRGGTAVNLNGWRLNAGEPDQNFGFPSFDLSAGASCRIYTNQVNADSCGGGTFGSGQAIWNNGGDCGTLYNAEGAEVSRYCW